MKAFSLTALTITVYLILTQLLGLHIPPMRKPLSFTSSSEAASSDPASAEAADSAALQEAPESAPATGLVGTRAMNVADWPVEIARETGQTEIDAPAPVEPVVVVTKAQAPASTGLLQEPVVIIGSAVDVEAAGAAVTVVETPVAAAPTPRVDTRWVVVDAPVDTALVESQTPQLDAFTAGVTNGQAGEVVGVFVQDYFALPVVQQPQGQLNYVATEDHLVTQFAAPKAYGTVGLLAHNYLSGKLFYNLSENQEVAVVYGDGRRQLYRISQVRRYQALSPTSAYSNFIDVNDPAQEQISAAALFSTVYAQSDQLVLQTCIEANGDFSWGRLFITAEKVAE